MNKTSTLRRSVGASSKRGLVRCETYLTPAELQAMAATTLLGCGVGFEGNQVQARGRALAKALRFYLAFVRRHGGDDLALLCGGAN